MIGTPQLLLLLSSCSAVHSRCDGLTVFDESENIVTDSVCIQKYATHECISFYNSFDQSDLPTTFPTSTTTAEKPTSMDVESIDSPFTDWIYPGLSITWASPSPGSTPCYGYLLVWFRDGKDEPAKCRLFHTKPENDANLMFKYTVEYVVESSMYTVRVYSMPPPDPTYKNDDRAFVNGHLATSVRYKANKETAKWAPYLWYDVQDDGTISLLFTLPPAEFNITIFMVYLLKSMDTSTVVSETRYVSKVRSSRNTLGHLTIPTYENDIYRIVMWLEDDLHMIPGQCRCWIWENSQRTCSNTCGGTSSAWFYVNTTAVC